MALPAADNQTLEEILKRLDFSDALQDLDRAECAQPFNAMLSKWQNGPVRSVMVVLQPSSERPLELPVKSIEVASLCYSGRSPFLRIVE